MNKSQFKHDFLRGLGSALIELNSTCNPKQFREIVMYGCLHNTTYDMQCEGDRGWYLYQAAQLVEDKEAIESAVIHKFIRYKYGDWLFVQFTSILHYFAKEGSENARAALYRKYDTILYELSSKKRMSDRIYCQRDMYDDLCIWLTSLDGWNMFKRVVQDVSELLLPKDTDCFFSEWFYDNSKGKFSKVRVENYLLKQSKKSQFVRVYYEKSKEWDNHVYEKSPVPTLDEFINLAFSKNVRIRGLALSFSKNASREDLDKLAQLATRETHPEIKVNLLRPFRRVKYPFPTSVLFELSKSDDENLRDVAFDIMEKNPLPEYREFSLSLIDQKKDVVNAISLLARTFRPEDEPLLLGIVKSLPLTYDDGNWHAAFMDVEDGIKYMRGKPKTDILEYLYRNTLCGSCRERIVRLMHKKKVLTNAILEECRFDSNSDIRTFANKIKLPL